jgi:apolipoprotein N-acyltransferase
MLALELVSGALQLIGVIGETKTPSAEQGAHGVKKLNDMMAELEGRGDYYNSVVSMGTSPIQAYRKWHLVPFGEFIPLRPVLGWVVSVLAIPLQDFTRGTSAPRPLAVAGQHVGVNVCYEDAFGEEIIRQLPAATLLVNVSNDGWFGESIAIPQHLQIARVRAAEAGRYLLRAANRGVTAVIDQRGRVVDSIPAFAPGVLRATVRGYTGSTPYSRVGNYLVVLACAAALVAAFAAGRRSAALSSPARAGTR